MLCVVPTFYVLEYQVTYIQKLDECFKNSRTLCVRRHWNNIEALLLKLNFKCHSHSNKTQLFMIVLAYLFTVQSVSFIALLSSTLFKVAMELDHVICCKAGRYVRHWPLLIICIILISSTMIYIATIYNDSRSGRFSLTSSALLLHNMRWKLFL